MANVVLLEGDIVTTVSPAYRPTECTVNLSDTEVMSACRVLLLPLPMALDASVRVYAKIPSMSCFRTPPSSWVATIPGVMRALASPVFVKYSVSGSAMPKNCL